MEQRYEEDGQYRCREYAADDAGADFFLADGARAGGDARGITPAIKAGEVMRMGRRESRTPSSAARNSSGVVSRDCAVMVASRCWPGTVGCASNSPAETWTYCAGIALWTSAPRSVSTTSV